MNPRNYSMTKCKELSSRKGSILIPAMIFSWIVILLTGSFLYLSFAEYRSGTRTFLSGASFTLAESGIDKAIDAIHDEDSSGWTIGQEDGIIYWARSFEEHDLGTNTSGQVNVLIKGVEEAEPVVYSEGVCTWGKANKVVRQLRVKLTRGYFAKPQGLATKGDLKLKGDNTTIDSFDSDEGPYSDETRNSEVVVSVGGESNIGEADVYGYVSTSGADPNVRRNGSITSLDNPNQVDYSRISTDFQFEYPLITAPSLDKPSRKFMKTPDAITATEPITTTTPSTGTSPSLGTGAITDGNLEEINDADDAVAAGYDIDGDGVADVSEDLNGDGVIDEVDYKWYINGMGPITVEPVAPTDLVDTDPVVAEADPATTTYSVETGEYVLRNLKIAEDERVQIEGDVTLVVANNVNLDGELQISENGKLDVFVDGNWKTSVNGAVNNEGVADQLHIIGTNPTVGEQLLQVRGASQLTAYVYAPRATVQMKARRDSDGGHIIGAVVANDATVTGGGTFTYDESLHQQSIGMTRVQASQWSELMRNEQRVDILSYIR